MGWSRLGYTRGRHTCASLLIAAGANAKVIQAVMGHATIQVTFDTYGHLMPGDEAEATRQIDAYLAGAEVATRA